MPASDGLGATHLTTSGPPEAGDGEDPKQNPRRGGERAIKNSLPSAFSRQRAFGSFSSHSFRE